MVLVSNRHLKMHLYAGVCVAALSSGFATTAMADTGLTVPLNRSSLVVLPSPVKEVMIDNPDIADVHAHNATTLTVVGKKAGHTNVRVFDETGKLLKTFDVAVGYDLPAIRKALKTFIPEETIGVEMVNASVALTGSVRNASTIDRALKITQDFIGNADGDQQQQSSNGSANGGLPPAPLNILNMLKVTSGQQVMLRVRVGEMNRDALKRLNLDPTAVFSGNNISFMGGVGTGIAGLSRTATGNYDLTTSAKSRGTGIFGWGNGQNRVGAAISALEHDGLFKLLSEPNLVAISGEEAEFLAGGEVPVPVSQGVSSGSSSASISVEYKPYGVSIKFTPDVLSENRIRMKVSPEVSEVDYSNSTEVGGIKVPATTTRRAKTTVELAPGESFMIAGLIKDKTNATIDQLPGLKNVPVLGAMFRSTEFQRNESELVIAVTPYLVDPLKSSDVKLPTDDFRPASQMEMFFYGVLGALNSDGNSSTQTPAPEGPTGFMVD